jgi:glucokinase
VDFQRSTVLFAPNLAWRDEPLRAAIEGRCGLPVVIENNANAAAWAEARFGAGRGEDHVVILTIGTAESARGAARLRRDQDGVVILTAGGGRP